eukprot:350943-Chlamydomonas_euryale.AAC.2
MPVQFPYQPCLLAYAAPHFKGLIPLGGSGCVGQPESVDVDNPGSNRPKQAPLLTSVRSRRRVCQAGSRCEKRLAAGGQVC